jgi:hypothetical protein
MTKLLFIEYTEFDSKLEDIIGNFKRIIQDLDDLEYESEISDEKISTYEKSRYISEIVDYLSEMQRDYKYLSKICENYLLIKEQIHAYIKDNECDPCKYLKNIEIQFDAIFDCIKKYSLSIHISEKPFDSKEATYGFGLNITPNDHQMYINLDREFHFPFIDDFYEDNDVDIFIYNQLDSLFKNPHE